MKTLILIDIQNDFLPGGALAVPEGDNIIPVVNRLMPQFDLVIASQDWHPAKHGSFASQHAGRQVGEIIELNGLQQILWPDHCIQQTKGAEFATDLQIHCIQHIFQKGTDPGIDSYSAFFDNGHRQPTGLGDFLKEKGVNSVHLAGLATDYCVKFSALDARQLGFETKVILEAIRGVELNPGDCEKAMDEMRQAGVQFLFEDVV